MRITNGGYVLEENKNSSSKTIIQVIVSGGQVNISTDNGTVNANQNNETKMVEKQIIIENKSNNYNQNIAPGPNVPSAPAGWMPAHRYPHIGAVRMKYPDNPKHPKQKYMLTEKGRKILEK